MRYVGRDGSMLERGRFDVGDGAVQRIEYIQKTLLEDVTKS